MSWLRDRRTRRPLARRADLLVEELGDELLVYDLATDQVHCLSSDAQRVWRGCDGGTSPAQLASSLKLDPELIDRALAELESCGLLDNEPADGVTRREATARLAKIGAAAAAAPLIYSIAAPPPAMAQTACGTGRFGCIGSTSANACTDVTTCRAAGAGCACCFLSPKGCTPNISWSACISGGCTSTCTAAYVIQLCNPPQVCSPTGKTGCST